jgi:hypothetical protein
MKFSQSLILSSLLITGSDKSLFEFMILAFLFFLEKLDYYFKIKKMLGNKKVFLDKECFGFVIGLMFL